MGYIALMRAVFPARLCTRWACSDSLVLFPSSACRCFGRRGPSLLLSSSLMRLMLSPVKEEGTVLSSAIEAGLDSETHQNMPVPSHRINIDFPPQSFFANCSLLAFYLLSTLCYFGVFGPLLSIDDKCGVIPVVCFNLLTQFSAPHVSHKDSLMSTWSKHPKICMAALSKPATWFLNSPLRLLRILLPANTERSLVQRRFSGLALGTSVA